MEAYSDRGDFFNDLKNLFRRVDGTPTVLSERATAIQQELDQSAEEAICEIPVASELVTDKLGQVVRGTVVKDDKYFIPVKFNPAEDMR